MRLVERRHAPGAGLATLEAAVLRSHRPRHRDAGVGHAPAAQGSEAPEVLDAAVRPRWGLAAAGAARRHLDPLGSGVPTALGGGADLRLRRDAGNLDGGGVVPG